MKPSEVAAVTLPISMGAALVAVLFLMGLNLTLEDMRAVRPAPVAKSVALLFLAGPLCAVALCLALELEPDWTLGVLLVAVTPPTVGASVFTFLVGGEVATALTTSVVSLLISAVAMPASFVAEVVLFNALGRVARPGGGRASRVTLKLPLAQIAATMLVLVLTAAGGLVAQNKCVEARRERAKVWIKRALKIVIPVCVASFIMADSLLSATYYGGDNAWRFWLAAVLVHLAPLPLSAAAAWRERPVTRDAIILTVIRRNPVIMFGVAALSFRDAPGVDFNRAFGIVAAAATTLDWVSLPLFLAMRYARYGKVCVVVKKIDAGEKRGVDDEADEEAARDDEVSAESKQPADDAAEGAISVDVAVCDQPVPIEAGDDG